MKTAKKMITHGKEKNEVIQILFYIHLLSEDNAGSHE